MRLLGGPCKVVTHQVGVIGKTIAREQTSGNLLLLLGGQSQRNKKYTTLEMTRGPFRGSRDK